MSEFKLALTIDYNLPPQRYVLGMNADPGRVWTMPEPDPLTKVDAVGSLAQLADLLEAAAAHLRSTPEIALAVPS